MTKGVGNQPPFLYIYGMMKEENKLNGLNQRHVAQIVRRKMIQRMKPSKKVYSRKNLKKDLEN